MEAHIQDGQSSEPFYPIFKILIKLLFKIKFKAVEILLIARHEMSQINTLLALANRSSRVPLRQFAVLVEENQLKFGPGSTFALSVSS